MGMRKLINDIDNERFLKESSMTMSMNRGRRTYCTDEQAESGALRLERKLDAPECHRFFLKVMYYLPDSIREELLAYSMRDGISSPKRYFTHSARKALYKLGH